MKKSFITLIIVFIISVVILNLFHAWSSQPERIVYLDKDFSYKLEADSNSSIYINILAFQNQTNQLILNFNYLNTPNSRAQIQINKTFSVGSGSEIAFIEVSDNLFYKIENIFPQKGAEINNQFVQFNINIVFYEGYIVVPIVIEEYEQKLGGNDLLPFIIKYSFPLYYLALPFGILRRDDMFSIKKGISIAKPILFATIFALISLFAGLSYVYIVFVVLILLLICVKILQFFDDNNFFPFYLFIMILFVINSTPISKGKSFLSSKINFLMLDFIIYPIFAIILCFLSAILIVYHLKKPKIKSEGISIVLYALSFLVLNIYFSRLIL